MAYAGKTGEPRRFPEARNAISDNESPPVGTFMAGLAIGLFVGAGVALMVAPERGADTRRIIRRGLRRAGLRGRDAWADLRLELTRARRELKRARRRARLAAETADASG